MKRALLFLALLPLGLSGTPTRVLTLDNQNLLVHDDFDGIYFYHLSPGYKNHLYVDFLSTGQPVGWAFLDVHIGTFTVWWNRPYGPATLFNTLGASTALGYSQADLGAAALNPHGPLEGRVKAPDMKIALGFGTEVSETLNLGLCYQMAGLSQERNSSAVDGSGAALVAGSPYSLARYFAPGAGFYGSLTETGYTNLQSAAGTVLVPMFGYHTDHFGLDAKLELIWNSIDNRHTEFLRDAQGGSATRVGTVTQSLKDKGALSWWPKARLRVPFGDGTLVLRGSVQNLDFSTEHRQMGSFSGGGFANADELAGFDHVDAAETLKVTGWDAMLGWVHTFEAKALVVLGVGANSASTHVEDILYTPRTGGPTLKYNDLVKSTRSDSVSDAFHVPVLMGAELSVTKWMKARGMLQQNFYASSRTTTQSQTFSSATGAVATQADAVNSSGQNLNLQVASGLGLEFGAFQWDMAFNAGLLASSGAWVNPALQSTLTWGY